MTDKYFHDIEERPEVFPNQWECDELFVGDVNWLCGDIDLASRLVTKSRLNSFDWDKAALDVLIRSYHEAWNYKDDLIICVWDVNQPESDAPLGFSVIDLSWAETNAKKICSVTIKVILIWVRPEQRGFLGFVARHVLAHLMLYLNDCKLVHPHVAQKGVDIVCYTDFIDAGGDRAPGVIEENLGYMQESGIWKIRKLVFDQD